MAAAVYSSFDVVLWFFDKSLDEGDYLQPQKLHRLLFLAQAYYAVANNGAKLMPAVFVAEEMGPVEPNIFHVYETGTRPYMDPHRLPEKVEHFLDSIWRRFGTNTAEHLSRVIRAHGPFVEAWAKGPRTEIALEAMRAFYGNPTRTQGRAPDVKDVVRPRVLRSQSGRAVAVKAWMPPGKK